MVAQAQANWRFGWLCNVVAACSSGCHPINSPRSYYYLANEDPSPDIDCLLFRRHHTTRPDFQAWITEAQIGVQGDCGEREIRCEVIRGSSLMHVSGPSWMAETPREPRCLQLSANELQAACPQPHRRTFPRFFYEPLPARSGRTLSDKVQTPLTAAVRMSVHRLFLCPPPCVL